MAARSVGFKPSQVRFFDAAERRLWTVPPAEEGNRIYAVAAEGRLAAWIEWRTGDTRKLLVRCTDLRTHAVRTLGEVVPPPGLGAGQAHCGISVSDDQVYWAVEGHESGPGDSTYLTVYGAETWSEDGELQSRLLPPADR